MKENIRVLVPVDGSEPSSHAAAFAGQFAETMGGSVDLLFISAFESGEVPPKGKERFYSVEQIVSSMQKPEDIFAAAKKELPEGLAVECFEETGKAAEKILDFSKEHGHELIIIGSKGKTAVQNFLLGSVSQKVMEEADSSVIIVK